MAFNEKELAFIEAVASGASYKDAYYDIYGGAGLSNGTLKNHAYKAATPEIRRAIAERKKELIEKAAKDDEILAVVEEEPKEVTRERLLSECDYVIRNTKPCIFKKLNGVPIVNKDAANVYLKAVELAARIIGAFEPEEKIDNTVVVEFSDEIKELSK